MAARIAELTRNAVDVLPEGELERKLALGRPLRVKLGIDPTAPRRRVDTSARPKPVESRHMETAVKTARTTRARTANAVDLTDASTNTATPPLPPRPCTSPIP